MSTIGIGDYVTAAALPYKGITSRVVSIEDGSYVLMTPFGLIVRASKSSMKLDDMDNFLAQTNDFVREEAQRIIDDPEYLKQFHF